MKVIQLKENPYTYSCNVYFILGDWNSIKDVNTLIDVGTNGFIINEIEKVHTGVGKRKLDKVLLTHTHYDHIGGLKEIKEKYNPIVYSHSVIKYVDEKIEDKQILHVGDRDFTVIHTPGHSFDSVCYYCEEEAVLFAGDTTINIKTLGGSYTEDFVQSLEKLARLRIKRIYHGHDNVIMENAEEIINRTLQNVKNSKIVYNNCL
jgi:glyoxylase-like metal-dependent hydrolase (beta-lactamase superfamily II)